MAILIKEETGETKIIEGVTYRMHVTRNMRGEFQTLDLVPAEEAPAAGDLFTEKLFAEQSFFPPSPSL
jgi:hypothetical protein